MMYASRTPPGVTRDQMCDPMCDVFVWREIWTPHNEDDAPGYRRPLGK